MIQNIATDKETLGEFAELVRANADLLRRGELWPHARSGLASRVCYVLGYLRYRQHVRGFNQSYFDRLARMRLKMSDQAEAGIVDRKRAANVFDEAADLINEATSGEGVGSI